MRVLVTGIDGFVGSHAAEFLLGIPSLEVHGTIVTARFSRNIEKIAPHLHLHEADILDSRKIESLFSTTRPDRVIHLAAQAFIPASINDPIGTFQANILGGISVLDAARRMKEGGLGSPAVLIVSTGEVYGRVEAEQQPITEKLPICPTNPYAASKASIDLIAQEYARSFGVNVTVVRPFNHAGPRQSPVFVCSDFGRQFAAIATGKVPARVSVGNLEARRDFTDVRDVVRAYWTLFQRRSDELVFNVCSGQVYSIKQVLTMLEEISGLTIEYVSEQQRFRAYDSSVISGSYERLKRATGWTPSIPLRQTLEDVYRYWQEELSTSPGAP